MSIIQSPELFFHIFTLTAVNIPWSCSWGNNGYCWYTWKKSAFSWEF